MPDPQHLSGSSKDDVVTALTNTLNRLQANDPDAIAALAGGAGSQDQNKASAVAALKSSVAAVQSENEPEGQPFHSRDPIAGIFQSQMESSIIPQLQAFSDGNPVVWIPAGIKGVFEHFKSKYPFKTATAASDVAIRNQCKIALLGDWGADNDHAKNVARQAMAHNPDYIVHLGDIYYSGSESECQTFLQNWPLKDAAGAPIKGRSFALNGNHEMYSLGVPYFTTVLDAFGQEASYFTLSNDYWQLHGLDSAYVPFSIGGGNTDDRLKVQWNWLRQRLAIPKKSNIFLSHNQPVSAHLTEYAAAQALMSEARLLLGDFGSQSIYGWFFGHEHRCVVYNDNVISAYFRARLIGNGAIGHPPQTEVAPQKDKSGADASPFTWVNKRSLEDKGIVAISSFALLTLNNDQIHIDYIDEDGFVGYSEDWSASAHL